MEKIYQHEWKIDNYYCKEIKCPRRNPPKVHNIKVGVDPENMYGNVYRYSEQFDYKRYITTTTSF